MTKIMLVEDDNNLREIYEARLLAEGYEIVSAKDGEEALATAVKEKPDLIISDVMMPKISGFDMLDILRSTPETKNTKVIMMTALSQSEDKARADKLGADRYLVKSQVTLEDVARVAREVLSGDDTPTANPSTAAGPDPMAATTSTDPSSTASATEEPIAAASAVPLDTPVSEPTKAPDPAASAGTPPAAPLDPALATSVADEEATVEAEIKDFVAQPATAAPVAAEPEADKPIAGTSDMSVKEAPVDEEADTAKAAEVADAVNKLVKETEPSPAAEPEDDEKVSIAGKKVIAPISSTDEKAPDLNELAAKEEQKDAVSPMATASTPPVASVVQPGGATVTPASSTSSAATDQPGNVITPTGGAAPDSSDAPADLAL